jgi:DNA-binding NarL/FixJ family response regulator
VTRWLESVKEKIAELAKLKVDLIFPQGAGLFMLRGYRQAEEIVRLLADTCDIVIVSFHGGAEGADNQHVPRMEEMFFTESRGDVYNFAHRMIDAGAKGFLLKNSDINEVRNAIRTVNEGRTFFSEELLLNVVRNIRTVTIPKKVPSNLSVATSTAFLQMESLPSNVQIFNDGFYMPNDTLVF